jgi:hypothetical protein
MPNSDAKRLIMLLASVELGPENALLPLTPYTIKRCTHSGRKSAHGLNDQRVSLLVDRLFAKSISTFT